MSIYVQVKNLRQQIAYLQSHLGGDFPIYTAEHVAQLLPRKQRELAKLLAQMIDIG